MPPRYHGSKKRKARSPQKRKHHKLRFSENRSHAPLTEAVDGEKEHIPEPSIVEFKIPWDILNTFLRPLVENRYLRNEFSGAIQTASGKQHHSHEHGAEHVESSSCSTEFVCMQRATIVRGSGDSAAFYEDIPYTYHTHPIYYYHEYGVRIAPPSGEDIGVFLRGCIEDKACVHFVIAKEGIYHIIPNPCFVHQARRLLKRDVRKYNVAMVGAEILGMQTHECRDSWTPQQWISWVRNQFVCKQNMLVEEYKTDIMQKFGHHCSSKECGRITDETLEQFKHEFESIVRHDFMLGACRYTNPIIDAQWGEGNWIDVGFSTWRELERARGLHVRYSVF